MNRTTSVVCLVVALSFGLALPHSAWAAACHTVTAKTWESTTNDYTPDAADAEREVNLSFTATVANLPSGKTIDDVTWEWKHDGTVVSTAQSMTYAFDGNHLGPQTVTVKATVDGESASDDGAVNVVDRLIIDTLTSRPDGKISFNDKNEVKGHVLPTTVSHLDVKLDWDCQGPPSEHCGLWDKATGNLNYVETYGGNAVWPTLNSDWGSDSLILTLDKRVKAGTSIDERDDLDTDTTDGGLQASLSVCLFYQATGKQNSAAGNPPNWFCYYKNNAGGGTYQYDGAGLNGRSYATIGGGMSTVRIADTALEGAYATHNYSNPNGRLKIIGASSGYSYYANFLAVLAHETEHATNQTMANETPNDSDGKDYITATYENDTSKTDPDKKFSARGYPDGPAGFTGAAWLDAECQAGGPIEKDAIDGANTSKDWAHPGTNWPN